MRRVMLRGGVLVWLALWAGCSPSDLGRPALPPPPAAASVMATPYPFR